MQFSDIAVTWRDSLKLLAWKELKPIILASINNFRRAIKLMFKYFWWFSLLWLMILALPTVFHVVLTPHQLFDAIIMEKIPTMLAPYRLYDVPWSFWIFTFIVFIFSTVDAIIYFICFLSTRASIEAKNFAYYLQYMPKIVFFWVAQLLIGCCLAPLALIPSLFTTNSSFSSIMTTIMAMLLSALPVLIGYAFFDHEKNMITHAFKKGLVLFIHFFPFMIMVSIMHLVVLLFLYGITMFILTFIMMPFLITSMIFGVFFIQMFFISVFFLSCYATIYIKIKHTYPNLFFA